MAEIEYQVDELLFRMNNLAGSSSLPEKPQGYLTDSTDASHGAGDDGISSGGVSEVRNTHGIYRFHWLSRLGPKCMFVKTPSFYRY